jgi:hypothetical protein
MLAIPRKAVLARARVLPTGFSCGAASAPTSTALTEHLVSVHSHCQRVLQLDETVRRVKHRCLDRNNHARLKRILQFEFLAGGGGEDLKQ